MTMRVGRVALIAGPLLALLVYLVLPDTYGPDAVPFAHAGKASAALGVWMAVWWLTEAVHVSVTALLPIPLLPLLGATKVDAATAPYGNPVIFLFMGGFVLSLAMERWGLHKRIALGTLRLVGSRPANVVGGFMLASAFLSLWVSNTATAVLMLPIGLSVIETAFPAAGEALERKELPEVGRNFCICLMLGIAYACSIGGLGTLIGTPPNLFLASFAKGQLGREITFARWLIVGLPLVAVFLPLTWLLLTRALFPIRIESLQGGEDFAKRAYAELGPMKRGEWIVLFLFACAAGLWIFRPLIPIPGLSDTSIAMTVAILTFVLPVERAGGKTISVLDWSAMKRLPWGILLLFGGGLSLADALESTGVSRLMGAGFSSLGALPHVVIVFGVVTTIVFLTELTSNTATAATLVPILAGVAGGLGIDPYLLIVPAAISASCAFMLPVATPPNAVVFGSGFVSIRQMARAGLWLNLIAIPLVMVVTYLLVPLL